MILWSTSTQFTVNYDGDVNGNGKTYVAYLWLIMMVHLVKILMKQVVKCDSYAGTGSTGLSVNVGFQTNG